VKKHAFIKISFKRIFTLGFVFLDYKNSKPSSHLGFTEGLSPSLGRNKYKRL
jgi:hypothetical protein